MKRALGFMNKALPITYNTYIGGISASVGTAALLATKLGISVGAISNFTVVGADIKCKITGSYVIPAAAFLGDTSINYYLDNDNLITNVLTNAFFNCTKLKYLELKGIVTLTGTGQFEGSCKNVLSLPNCTSLPNLCHITTSGYVYIPLVTSLGTTAGGGDQQVFFNTPSGTTVYFNSYLATNNAGSPDGDVAYITAVSGVVKYVSSYVAPVSVTTLAVGNVYSTAIQLNFTHPTGSTNAIDFYEIFANDVYNRKITGSGFYATGLTPSTAYNLVVYSVDIYGNKSVVSNTVSQTTNSASSVPLSGLVSYYKLDETSGSVANDVYGTENLTNTSITVNQSGKLGTSYLSTANAQKLETTTATSITGKFTINTWLYRTAAPSSTLGGIIQQGDFNLNSGFGLWLWADNGLSWRINQVFRNVPATLVIPLNTWTMVTFTYDSTNVKIYIDSVLQVTTAHTANPISATRRTFFYNYNNNASFIGRIDESAIYNTDLSQAQINTLYNSGNGITL